MVLFQKSNFTRELPKTKAELRQILVEAVRNTQPTPGHRSKPAPKAKKRSPPGRSKSFVSAERPKKLSAVKELLPNETDKGEAAN